MAATVVVENNSSNWRDFELWVVVASCKHPDPLRPCLRQPGAHPALHSRVSALAAHPSQVARLPTPRLGKAEDTLRAIARTNGACEELTLAEGDGGARRGTTTM